MRILKINRAFATAIGWAMNPSRLANIVGYSRGSIFQCIKRGYCTRNVAKAINEAMPELSVSELMEEPEQCEAA